MDTKTILLAARPKFGLWLHSSSLVTADEAFASSPPSDYRGVRSRVKRLATW
jgi:hypothetical protein